MRKQCPDAMNLGGKKGIQVNRLVGEGILNQEESGYRERRDSARGQKSA